MNFADYAPGGDEPEYGTSTAEAVIASSLFRSIKYGPGNKPAIWSEASFRVPASS